MQGASTSTQPREFCNRERAGGFLFRQRSGGSRGTHLAGSAGEGGGGDAGDGNAPAAPASLITAWRWAWGQAAAGRRQGGHVSWKKRGADAAGAHPDAASRGRGGLPGSPVPLGGFLQTGTAESPQVGEVAGGFLFLLWVRI